MVRFEFKGQTYERDVSWDMAMKVADRVGDPHRILANGGEVGLIDAVRIVSIFSGVSERDLGEHAMKVGARDIYRVAGEVLLGTIPTDEDAPEDDGAKKT